MASSERRARRQRLAAMKAASYATASGERAEGDGLDARRLQHLHDVKIATSRRRHDPERAHPLALDARTRAGRGRRAAHDDGAHGKQRHQARRVREGTGASLFDHHHRRQAWPAHRHRARRLIWSWRAAAEGKGEKRKAGRRAVARWHRPTRLRRQPRRRRGSAAGEPDSGGWRRAASRRRFFSARLASPPAALALSSMERRIAIPSAATPTARREQQPRVGEQRRKFTGTKTYSRSS